MKNKPTKLLKQIYNEALICEMPERMFIPYPGNKQLEDNEYNR